jgi:tetratricopeptide (TPR) repeat protein
VTTDEDEPFPPLVYRQDIRVENGVGYGVIGADMHVFGDGVPLYLLENWHNAPEADPAWLRELPSRLLNARFEVVDFTGRGSELGQLHEWRRRGGPRLAVRWLHGPAGAGKTRLAAKFASESVADNWKVVIATPGPGVLLPVLGSQDLRPDGADGLLLIIDYADRWPATHLAMLLSNRLFRHRSVKTRILMVARTADDWPGIRHKLIGEQPALSSQMLEPLPEDPANRMEMFTAALTGFARHYGAADVSGLRPPGPLEQADFALTLAVHMAALATLDAHVSGRRAPSDMAGLTVYLLDRENHHWAQLYGDGTHELNPGERTFRTEPAMLRRAVFTAALTGPVDRATGIAILEGLAPEVPDPHQVLNDHAICYPPASPSRADALEPLYPDRLTEDFIALTIPGHGADYPDQPWAGLDTWALLGRLIDNDLSHLRTPNARLPAARRRAVIFLASAAQRWPHVATNGLFPILRMFPLLAVAAGGPALTALASVGGPGPLLDDELLTVLEGIDRAIPNRSDLDLDIGADHLAERLAGHYLNSDADPAAKAFALSRLFARLRNAGRPDEALTAAEQALAILRPLAESDPQYLGDLAVALDSVSTALSDVGRSTASLAPAREAVEIFRRLAAADPARQLPVLARFLDRLGTLLSNLGQAEESLILAQEADAVRRQSATGNPGLVGDEAVARAQEAVAISRRLVGESGPEHLPILAQSLINLGRNLADTGRLDEGLVAGTESITIYRRLSADSPAVGLPGLADALDSLGNRLAKAGRIQEGLPYLVEAVQICRGLAEDYPEGYLLNLAGSLRNLCAAVSLGGDPAGSLPLAEEAVAITRKIAVSGDPLALTNHGFTLNNLTATLLRLGRFADALPLAQETVAIFQRVAELEPWGERHALRTAQANLGAALSAVGHKPAGRKWFRRRPRGMPSPAPATSGAPPPTAPTPARPPTPAYGDGEEFERFSDQARRVMVLAQEEAKRLNHNYIGTEHILLGLISGGEGAAARALESLGISPEPTRNQVEEITGRGREAPSGHIPFSPRAMTVIKLSPPEADRLGHHYVAPEHILLGLIREGENVATQVMERLGVDPSAVSQRLAREYKCISEINSAPEAPD